jgi:sugar phosphate isomerase/epimerase
MSTWIEEVMGLPLGDLVRKNPRLAEDVRSRMLAGIAQIRSGPPPTTVECWAVSERFQGIQVAGLVVVNVRDPAERPAAGQLLVDLARLRKDDALFNDILGTRGHRTPITAVVANMADPRDAGRKKAVARVRRTIRAQARCAPIGGVGLYIDSDAAPPVVCRLKSCRSSEDERRAAQTKGPG